MHTRARGGEGAPWSEMSSKHRIAAATTAEEGSNRQADTDCSNSAAAHAAFRLSLPASNTARTTPTTVTSTLSQLATRRCRLVSGGEPLVCMSTWATWWECGSSFVVHADRAWERHAVEGEWRAISWDMEAAMCGRARVRVCESERVCPFSPARLRESQNALSNAAAVATRRAFSSLTPSGSCALSAPTSSCAPHTESRTATQAN